MDIRMVVCDLDGTLFDSSETLPAFANEFVPELKARGIHFTIATGRSPYLLGSWPLRLNVEIPYVAAGGALIAQEGRTLTSHSFAAWPLRETLEKADALGMSIIFCHGTDEDTALRRTPWVAGKNERSGIYHSIFFPSDAQWETLLLQKIIVIDKQNDVDRVYRQFRAFRHVDVVYFGKGGLEILPKGRNKATGVRELANMMGVDLQDVLAIGNDANDLEMLAECGASAVVKSAYPSAKEKAKYICQKDLAEGVREAIDHFCG